ncbi:hypothetical protein EVU97_14535 [Dermacoccus sp. 147Ba]|uniref:hypothetical protein n=1 Tax=Dermacoccus sp. 147Ba TaxID=2510111 RepID=UPI00101D69EF|nr:hypothetical protein [Dermacoccus sp. 147Ba]RYI20446.1 hypothetical protein EVU97_14535 [Dermacoccus sp. 147Ba]
MTKKNVDWAKFAAHRDTPTTPPDADAQAAPEVSHDAPAAPQRAAETPRAKRPRREPKYPASYRLPADVLDMIEAAVDAAADDGVKLSKEDAVAAAIRTAYGDLLA